MNDFLRTPLGGAILAAIAVPLGLFVFSSIGWTDESGVSTYIFSATAGFVGGWVGAVLRQRRMSEQLDANG
ncbi:MAG: hypothetical protein PVJ28_00070 [Acidimicrobiia bacterium]|jgi:hypothetical protein